MIQLTVLMWAMAALFAYIGFTRGWNKEMIATSGIILGLFALTEFSDVIDQMLITAPPSQKYFFRITLFAVIVFFAYQTRALGEGRAQPSRSRRRGSGRGTGGRGADDMQSSVLGGIMGFINGYLIWGSMWYFMHPDYPLNPYISAPLPGSVSERFVDSLPLAILSGGDGNMLAGAVIVLFVIVLIVI
jgi:hypothetical protein